VEPIKAVRRRHSYRRSRWFSMPSSRSGSLDRVSGHYAERSSWS